jgi:hypothetical protein
MKATEIHSCLIKETTRAILANKSIETFLFLIDIKALIRTGIVAAIPAIFKTISYFINMKDNKRRARINASKLINRFNFFSFSWFIRF